MQIIIVQTEIEEAIRNLIRSQVEVKEGMEIEIDLKATRGDTGMQAFIDIVPATGNKRTVAPKAAPAAVKDAAKTTTTRKASGEVAKGPATTQVAAAPAVTQEAASLAPSDAQPVAETVGKTGVETAEAVAAADQGVEEGPKADAPAEVAQQTINERIEDQPAPQVVAAAAEAAQATGGERKSLFGNLSRPTNTTAE